MRTCQDSVKQLQRYSKRAFRCNLPLYNCAFGTKIPKSVSRRFVFRQLVRIEMHRILVIDDDIELCQLVAEYLETEGYKVDAVHDGEAGVARALTGEHGLAVLDYMLPGINGFEVLRQIRASSRLPIVMLTARGDHVNRIVGLQMGAD